jgi:hypothetical protein
MREYKIIKTELWWILSRKKQMGRLMILQYLYGSKNWWPNKWLAKTFYHQGSAESALVIMRRKDEEKEG